MFLFQAGGAYRKMCKTYNIIKHVRNAPFLVQKYSCNIKFNRSTRNKKVTLEVTLSRLVVEFVLFGTRYSIERLVLF